MEANNELRIGSIVKSKGFSVTYEVTEIKSENVLLCQLDGNHIVRVLVYMLEPIPISEEWLFKFGFDKRKTTEDGIIYGILNFTIVYGRTMEGEYAFFLNGYHNDCHIEYVHQLQNLYFSLTGKELQLQTTNA